ncbi:MAG: LysE family translocator [Alphaproteobacteria bacterium]|nr:LysE family translocator [Alphaproteobacteria bacterium]
MPVEIWLAFVVASTVLLAIPGPTVMLVVSYAIGQGRHTGWATVPGVTLGDFTAMTISLLGAGAILAASATLFTALKLAGAAYLIWLGVKLWRSNPTAEDLNGRAKGRGRWAMFGNAFMVTALNPKGIVFFIAFVPQFVVTERPLGPQFVILEATFLFLAAINVALWAILAGEMRARFQSPAMMRITSRIGGCFLIGAGFLTAAVRRAS